MPATRKHVAPPRIRGLEAFLLPSLAKDSRHLHSLPDYLLDDIGMGRSEIDVEIRTRHGS